MEAEHRRFFDWLAATITSYKAEVLLVSGDIFDTGYPSNASLKLYYQFLTHLQHTPCHQVIITGGNHDSVSTLEAPREVLRHLNIQVVGGAPENPADALFGLYDKHGDQTAWVGAVPFLRDRDIRKSVADETYSERVAMIKAGIQRYYHKLATHIREVNTSKLPVITMGHLFMTGASAGDSERDIHIGNLGHVEAEALPENTDYWALGHIHSPQQVAGSAFIRYSGSPLPLSFSERSQHKEVLLLRLQDNRLHEPQPVEVPAFRKLIRFRGTAEEVFRQINQWQSKDSAKAWADVEITEEKHNPALVRQVDRKSVV